MLLGLDPKTGEFQIVSTNVDMVGMHDAPYPIMESLTAAFQGNPDPFIK